MSDAENLPAANDGNPSHCAKSCCARSSMLMRAFLYTPVILSVTGLGAMAMFPGLADHVLGPATTSCSSTCSSSSGNPNCPIQMLMRTFWSSPKQEMPREITCPASAPISSTNSPDLAMDMFDCCPTSGYLMQLRTQVCTGSGSTYLTVDEPADALAAISASQAKPDAVEESPASN